MILLVGNIVPTFPTDWSLDWEEHGHEGCARLQAAPRYSSLPLSRPTRRCAGMAVESSLPVLAQQQAAGLALMSGIILQTAPTATQ
ncbi:unnamed protein product [Boreogadus saida]